MNVEEGFTIEDAQKQEALLRPYHDLWKSDLFQKWVAEMDLTVNDISDQSVYSDWGDQRILGHLKMLGLRKPDTPEQELRLYIALRAVVAFWKRKLALLKSQSERYEQTERKISELGRQGSVGITRVAAL